MNPLPQVQRQLEARAVSVGAGAPAKQATRWMAPALPVFAGKPAPTGTV
ncbi:type II secretion system protein J [Pseudomonas plecoglossicida]|nr:type II secretion system protein J [Pseudomonas plecoglossicida]